MAILPHHTLTRQQARLHQLLAGSPRIDWQACEQRLVLSAQLLSEIIDPLQLQQHAIEQPIFKPHGTLASDIDRPFSNHLSGNEIGSAPGLEPQASAAHTQTGWSALQQEFGLKGSGQTVAVIDSGIAWDHVALGKGFGLAIEWLVAGTLQRTIATRMTMAQRDSTERTFQALSAATVLRTLVLLRMSI